MIRHALAPVLPAAASGLGLPRTVNGAGGVVLTFDDGPHPQGTPAVLDALHRAHARAMFFLVGEQVERRPELVREILAGGHTLALHGHRHRLQLRLSDRALEQDLARGRAAIEEAGGTTIEWHRPPYGIYSPAGLTAARRSGLKPLLWSRWGKDWRRWTTPARIARRAAGELTPGDVILLHDADFYSARNSHQRTAQALQIVLDRLRGLEIATVLPA